MKVALTGGTGLVGRHLVEALLAAGHEVRALARPRPGRELPRAEGLEWVEGDLGDPPSLARLAQGSDAIVHAGYGGEESADSFVRTNVLATLGLIELAGGTGARRLVYVSSLAVYGDAHVASGASSGGPGERRRPRDEDAPVWPRDFYGAHKAALEKFVVASAHAYGLDACALRLGWVLGDGEAWERGAFARAAREAAEHGEIRTPLGAYVIAVEDAAALLAAAVEGSGLRGEVLNVFARWYDVVEAAPGLAAALGRPVGVACAASPEPDPPIENARLLARGARFRTEERLRELLAASARRLRHG